MTLGDRAAAAAIALAAALPAAALESAAWPPSQAEAERMRALQQRLSDPGATPAEREAARAELSAMLRSPAGRERGEAPARARAAIAPLPPLVRPVDVAPATSAPPPEGVARLEVVEPPKPLLDPLTGRATSSPTGSFVIDPATGRVLHPAPGGYVDPATGRHVTR